MFKTAKQTGFLLLLALMLQMPMVQAISLSYGSSGYDGSVTVSEKYDLDDSTSLVESTDLGSGSVNQRHAMAGNGLNLVSKSVSGSTYSLETATQSYGSLGISGALSASGTSGDMSQSVGGAGYLTTGSGGSTGREYVYNIAQVENGYLSTTQSIAAGSEIAGAQSTTLSGDIGIVGSMATSGDSGMVVTGDIIGGGSMDADLRCATSAINGQVSVDGTRWLSSEDMNIVKDSDFGIAVEGLRVVGDGIGAFGVNAGHVSTQGAVSTKKSTTYYQNDPRSYTLTGWRWNRGAPITIYLKNDANLASEGLDPTDAMNAISDAAKTWDGSTKKSLFSNVILDSTKKADNPYDGVNVHAFKSFSGASASALAYSRTRYGRPKVDGYYTVFESDVSYNTRYSWTTNLNNAGQYKNGWIYFDLQTVALHELGHTFGLGDLYTLRSTDPRRYDYSQIMNSYNDPQRTLGAGDIAGIQKLYGRPA